MDTRPKCSERIFDGSGHNYACARVAKVRRDGKGYCIQHDPVRRKEQREKRDEAREAKWKAFVETRDREHEEARRRASFLDAAQKKVTAHAGTFSGLCHCSLCTLWREHFPAES